MPELTSILLKLVYKANLLTDIVSKVMTDVHLPEMRNCLKMKFYRVTGVQSVVMNFHALVFSCHVRLNEHFFVM